MANIPPTCGQLLPPHATLLMDGVDDKAPLSLVQAVVGNGAPVPRVGPRLSADMRKNKC